MYPHISNAALLWALGFISSAPDVALQCAAALAIHSKLLPECEALVGLHEPAFVVAFLERRFRELGLNELILLRSDGARVFVKYSHKHGVEGWPVRLVDREYSLEEARALLEHFLTTTGLVGFGVVCDAFGVASMSPIVQGDVLEAIDSREARSWYGSDRNAPRPGEHWVIERPWTHTATMRRVPDGVRRTSQTFILLDKRVWRLIGFVRNIAAIATMGGKDAPALDIVLTEERTWT